MSNPVHNSPMQTPLIQSIANAIQCELDPTVPVVYEAVSADEHELYELIPATDMEATLTQMVDTKFDVLSDTERTMIKRVRLQAEESCRACLVDAIHRQDQDLIDQYTSQLLGLM